ncbi:hypothetical protein [Sphingomicrobium flavum]|uniref:hypothetical protein n=1 Tax=Sphingomicrobium flavum TaxID=1229164 RepID=UPI0021AE0434|nr:hypothetical protein [Sphingomicrobium flavum]
MLKLIPKVLGMQPTMPYFAGKAASAIPFSFRPGVGKSFRTASDRLAEYEQGDGEARKDFIFRHTKAMATYAYDQTHFYRQLYGDHGVDPHELKHFDELSRLPVITKADLQLVPMEQRSSDFGPRIEVNTGGTSGQPLSLYLSANSYGNEWAHMLPIWHRVGYRQTEPRLIFSGRTSGEDIIFYDGFRHGYVLNLSHGWDVLSDAIMKERRIRNIGVLHGYPSAIFDFVEWLQQEAHPLLKHWEKTVRILLLGSELPSPAKRKKVGEILSCKSVSWYGHTERAVLAGEDGTHFEYHPMQSYSFAETIEAEDGHHLVGTNYNNFSSPLVRYDTSDLVKPTYENGIMTKFTIEGGRSGDYVIDANGQKIFLTSLIFGRHHKLFDNVYNLQVRQTHPGACEILYVPKEELSHEAARAQFDGSGTSLSFSFRSLDNPIRTANGKLPLLVRE